MNSRSKSDNGRSYEPMDLQEAQQVIADVKWRGWQFEKSELVRPRLMGFLRAGGTRLRHLAHAADNTLFVGRKIVAELI